MTSKKTLFLNAARDGDISTVRSMLNEGFPVDSRSRNKSSALIRAAGEGNLRIVQLLLKHGADVNAQNLHGETALCRAAENGHKPITELLLAAGAAIDGSDDPTPFDPTPLTQSLLRGHHDIAAFLRQHGADPDLAMGPIVWQNRLDLLDVLIEMGANVNEGTSRGYTPLMRAATGVHINMVMALLSKGADPNARSELDETALGQALLFSSQLVAPMLLQHGARIQFLNEAVLLDEVEVVKKLLSEGASTEDTRPFVSGTTPLFNSVCGQNYEITELLLENKANPNLKYGKRTLLDVAVERGGTRIVNALLKAGSAFHFN